MKEVIDKETGEILSPATMDVVVTRRKNGSIRVQHDFSDCVSLTEMHGAHANDPNYLVQRYKPDELSLYLRSREAQYALISGHDFSREPDAQEARNEVYRLQSAFRELPEKVQKEFDRNFVSFLKYIDGNPSIEDMKERGIYKHLVVEKPAPTTSKFATSEPAKKEPTPKE